MFNALASYLLGATNSPSADDTEDNNNIRLTSVVSEDDWVVVNRDDDRDSEGNSDVESVTSEPLTDCDNTDTDKQNSLPCLLTRTSSVSSLPCTTIDESWYITPPPCFTSAGPIVMETSPLENLLIEHPSMSVYNQRGSSHILRCNLETTVPVPVYSIEKVEDDEESTTEVQEGGDSPRANVASPGRIREDIVKREEKQRLKCRESQKVQVERACQSLKRRYLERNNKAREVNCRNWRQRRGERSQGANRSCVNNNRKC